MQDNRPWYRKYTELRSKVYELRSEFVQHCQKLGVNPLRVFYDLRNEVIPTVFGESEWDKDHPNSGFSNNSISDLPRLPIVQNSGLDLNGVAERHFYAVRKLWGANTPLQDLGQYNLSRAYQALWWIRADCIKRISNSAQGSPDIYGNPYPAKNIENTVIDAEQFINLEKLSIIHDNFDAWRRAPQLHIGYIHLLHLLVMMGFEKNADLSVFRQTTTNVGDPSLFFPFPSDISRFMDMFCNYFPILLQEDDESCIELAAQISYRLIGIHPYINGNGRISRLLMNLILINAHPPVCLKMNNKERHKYHYALHRATRENRGNTEALASLICERLINAYTKLQAAFRL